MPPTCPFFLNGGCWLAAMDHGRSTTRSSPPAPHRRGSGPARPELPDPDGLAQLLTSPMPHCPSAPEPNVAGRAAGAPAQVCARRICRGITIESVTPQPPPASCPERQMSERAGSARSRARDRNAAACGRRELQLPELPLGSAGRHGICPAPLVRSALAPQHDVVLNC